MNWSQRRTNMPSSLFINRVSFSSLYLFYFISLFLGGGWGKVGGLTLFKGLQDLNITPLESTTVSLLVCLFTLSFKDLVTD